LSSIGGVEKRVGKMSYRVGFRSIQLTSQPEPNTTS